MAGLAGRLPSVPSRLRDAGSFVGSMLCYVACRFEKRNATDTHAPQQGMNAAQLIIRPYVDDNAQKPIVKETKDEPFF